MPDGAAPIAVPGGATTTYAKAYLETEKSVQIPCMFNPASLSLSRSNTWEKTKLAGKGVPSLSFGGSSSGSFSLNLFFDTTDTGKAVTDITSKIAALMDIESSLPGSNEATHNARPPWVRFCWGSLRTFKAVITSFSLNLTYFSPTGVPLRAEVSLSLEQFEPDQTVLLQNPTSHTPFPHRVHRVLPGETLDRISASHYGDSTRWRRIAAANGIEDPLSLRAGSLLRIPEED
jgi:hypothetical protein